MIHQVLRVGPLQCNCSILADEISREAIVVDPGEDIAAIQAILVRLNLTVRQILITHAHIDHIGGATTLKRLTGAPILYNQNDLPLVAMMEDQAEWLGVSTPEVAPPDHDLTDGLTFGVQGLRGTVHHTPGHTQGSVCLHLPDQSLVLAGDTLFAGGVGRTDLPGGDTTQLLHSIQDRLLTLPEQTVVLPGHGPVTTIGEEQQSNPFLQNL